MFSRLLPLCDRNVQRSVVSKLHAQFCSFQNYTHLDSHNLRRPNSGWHGHCESFPESPCSSCEVHPHAAARSRPSDCLVCVHVMETVCALAPWLFLVSTMRCHTERRTSNRRLVGELLTEREQRRDAVDFVLDVQPMCDPSFSQTTAVTLPGLDGYVIRCNTSCTPRSLLLIPVPSSCLSSSAACFVGCTASSPSPSLTRSDAASITMATSMLLREPLPRWCACGMRHQGRYQMLCFMFSPPSLPSLAPPFL
jgi:hypothetical protein